MHATFVLLLALPQPAITPTEMDKPGVQEWFDRMHARLTDAGISVTREDMIATAATWGGRYSTARDAVLAPAIAYATYTGAKQSWRMFGEVSPDSARFRVERLDPDGTWRPCFVARHPEHDWKRPMFDQERVRTLVNNFAHKRARSSFKRLGRFLYPRLQADFPDALGYRIHMESIDFPHPDELARTGQLIYGKKYWGERLDPIEADTPVDALRKATEGSTP